MASFKCCSSMPFFFVWYCSVMPLEPTGNKLFFLSCLSSAFLVASVDGLLLFLIEFNELNNSFLSAFCSVIGVNPYLSKYHVRLSASLNMPSANTRYCSKSLRGCESSSFLITIAVRARASQIASAVLRPLALAADLMTSSNENPLHPIFLFTKDFLFHVNNPLNSGSLPFGAEFLDVCALDLHLTPSFTKFPPDFQQSLSWHYQSPQQFRYH